VRHEYRLDRCPTCADQTLVPLADDAQIHYEYELVEKPIILHAHQAHGYWRATCDSMQRAPLPLALRQEGLVGPLTGLIGYLKGSGPFVLHHVASPPR
jgi:hypothetical protein